MYADADKQIFTFHDGTKDRAVDPIAVYIAISEQGLDLSGDIVLAENGDGAALGRVVTAFRSAFGIEPFHLDAAGKPAGLTITDTMKVVLSFGEWLTDAKKKSSPSLTSGPSTEPSPSQVQPAAVLPQPASPFPPASTTPPFAGFGSAANGPAFG